MAHLPDKLGYFLRVLRQNPTELIRIGVIVWNTFRLRYVQRIIGPGTVVGTGNQFIDIGNIRIGRNCLLQDSIYIRAGTQGHVTIGDEAALNSFCRLFGHGGIEIGTATQLGPGTLVTTTGHDYAKGLEAHFSKVVIGNRVWIGANATILPGVTIGDNAVIGAGSLVNRDIPANVVAVGVPARVIRHLDEKDGE